MQEGGDQPGALEAFIQCTEVNPSREQAFLNIALLQQYTSAPLSLQACVSALKANPESHDAYTIMGGLMERSGKYDAALQAYTSAIKMEPKAKLAHAGRVR